MELHSSPRSYPIRIVFPVKIDYEAGCFILMRILTIFRIFASNNA